MSVNKAPSNASDLWLYFKKSFGPSGKFLQKAECLTCSKHFAYKGHDYHGSLWRHLKKSHGVECNNINKKKASGSAPKTVQKKVIKTITPPAATSKIVESPVQTIKTANVPIYRYFSLYKSGKVKCRVCMSAALPAPFMINQPKSMLTHLKTHPRAHKLYELEKKYGQCGPEFDESIHLSNKTSSIFAQANDGKYHCQLCRLTISGSKQMQKHLNEKHAIAEQDIGNDVIYTEVISVGDNAKKRTASTNKTFKPKFLNNPRQALEVTKQKANNDVDAFGQYVTTLLKSMPKEDSTKLQQTIINKIIETKLKASYAHPATENTSITQVESEEVADDDGDDITEIDEEEVMTEEHLESIDEEDGVENREEVQAECFEYGNILELG